MANTIFQTRNVAALILLLAASGLLVFGVATRTHPLSATDIPVHTANIENGKLLYNVGDIISHLPGPRGASTMDDFRAMSRAMGPENFAQQSDALAHRIDLWQRMSEINCAVLCLWGDHDQFASPDVGRKIAASVPHGQFSEIKDCGHFPTLEYPEESAALVAKFLNGLT